MQERAKHQRRIRDDSNEEPPILQLVDEIRQEQTRMGTRKLVDQLKKRHDTEVGRDHLFALHGREGRLVKVKKRF